jgi:hypothetical protein
MAETVVREVEELSERLGQLLSGLDQERFPVFLLVLAKTVQIVQDNDTTARRYLEGREER